VEEVQPSAVACIHDLTPSVVFHSSCAKSILELPLRGGRLSTTPLAEQPTGQGQQLSHAPETKNMNNWPSVNCTQSKISAPGCQAMGNIQYQKLSGCQHGDSGTWNLLGEILNQHFGAFRKILRIRHRDAAYIYYSKDFL